MQKPASVMVWYGGASVPLCLHGWSAYMWKYTIDAEAYVGILRVNTTTFPRIFCCQQRLLQRNSMSISAGQCQASFCTWVTTEWLRRHRCVCLDRPACSPDLSPIENVWRIMKRRIRQRRPQTVEQLKSCIHQEWAKIQFAKLQQLISSVPKWLQSVN